MAARAAWLASADAVLSVLCMVAQNGHDARGFASLSRAFRGDEQLWDSIKDRRSMGGRTVLMAAAAQGCLRRVRWLLLRGADVNAAEAASGMTALLWACRRGAAGVVRELLAHGADAHAVSTGATAAVCTSLMTACEAGHLEVARELLGRGVSVQAPPVAQGQHTSKGPLHLACESGSVELVRELLAKGADASYGLSGDGWTCAMTALQNGRADIAGLLYEHGATPPDEIWMEHFMK